VVTIVGPGGAGKSRLALRFGFDSLPAFDDGVWHVELEQAKSESGIWERIAAACGVPDGRADSVLRALQAKRVLLLLDTCEHVLSDVRAVTQRLSRASGLRIVAASRRKLDVAGERVLELGPLETPPPHPTAGDSPMRYPAYRLFLERAAMARPAFRVDSRDVRALSELLRSIDGLPLAIELLAARANLLTIEGMRKRLSATLRSRRTIEDTVAWSYDLLSAGQQELFARLSAFHGTFTADDVEALAHGIAEPLESLFELADTSLIALSGGPQDARYRMLETTRFFARDRLRESASHVSTLLAHAEHVAKKTEKFSRIDDSALADVFGEAALLMPDVLAALESCTAFNWFECATRILDAVYRFGLRGHFSTDLLQLTLSLAAAAQGHEQVRAHFRQLAGGFAEAHGDVQLTLQLHEHAVEYYRNCRNEEELCAALTGMAVAEFKLAHYDRCELLLSEVLEHAQRAGDTMREAKTLARLGSVYSSRGEAARAMSTLQSAVRALRTLGDVRQLAMALRNLACLAFYEGQFAKLLPWIDEAIELTDKTADFPLYMTSLSMRASAQRELNRIAEAAASHSAICAQLSRLPHGGDLIDCLDDAAATLERAGEAALAARALGLARVLREQTGHMPEPKLQAYNDRLLERLQRSLNGSFQMELAAGARESVETLAASMMERFSAIR
jgi:predicted ATPase